MDDLVTLLTTTNLYRFVDVVGVVANGLLGGIVARQMRFDIIGFMAISMISGLGGGVLRDLMLTTRPVMLTDPAYLVGVLISAAVAFLITLHDRWLRRLLILADSLAMGCWAAAGAVKGLAFGLSPLPAILMGVITAVGGGMMRDVLTGRVPSIFGGNTLYALPAFIGAVEALVFVRLGMSDLGMGLAILTCSCLGLAAKWFKWSLPEARDWTLPRKNPKAPRRPHKGPRDPQ